MLGPEISQCKSKVNKAVSFCLRRLGDLRAEERRRVKHNVVHELQITDFVFLVQILGIKPFQEYATLTTEEFSERFSSFLRVESDDLALYKTTLPFLVNEIC